MVPPAGYTVDAYPPFLPHIYPYFMPVQIMLGDGDGQWYRCSVKGYQKGAYVIRFSCATEPGVGNKTKKHDLLHMDYGHKWVCLTNIKCPQRRFTRKARKPRRFTAKPPAGHFVPIQPPVDVPDMMRRTAGSADLAAQKAAVLATQLTHLQAAIELDLSRGYMHRMDATMPVVEGAVDACADALDRLMDSIASARQTLSTGV